MDCSDPRILVVGSINNDVVIPVDRMPEPGESMLCGPYSFISGGKGANQAVAAARLGADVTFCGRIGNDEIGGYLKGLLKKDGIRTTYMKRDDKEPTGLAVIPTQRDGGNRIFVSPGANMTVTQADVLQAFEREYDLVMLQLEIPLETIYFTIELAGRRGIPVVLDAGPAMALDASRLKGLYILSPNETEIYALTGIRADTTERAIHAASMLARQSEAQYVVVKMGSRGALLYSGGLAEFFPTYEDVVPVDTTAAGDAFTAALAVQMLRTGDISGSIRYANAVGSLCVSRMGAQPSLPYKREVERFLKEHGGAA